MTIHFSWYVFRFCFDIRHLIVYYFGILAVYCLIPQCGSFAAVLRLDL